MLILCVSHSCVLMFFFFKHKTAYEMRISDWSSDVCSSDLEAGKNIGLVGADAYHAAVGPVAQRQAEGIEHDRLACAGFSADDAHAAFQLEVEEIGRAHD